MCASIGAGIGRQAGEEMAIGIARSSSRPKRIEPIDYGKRGCAKPELLRVQGICQAAAIDIFVFK
jgi:hypothetical protein